MNFSINRDLLLQNLSAVSKALSTKVQMPVLTGIKIEVTKNHILMTASNNEISIQAKISDRKLIRIEEEGVFVAPGKYLIDLVRKTDSKDIDFISYEDNSIKILAGKSDFTLKGLDKDTYPLISFDESQTLITIDAANLKQIIRKSTFAASTSEARVILTGVSFQTNKNEMKIVSTDSYRLSRKVLLFDVEYPDIKIVIPAKSLDELNKIVEEGEEVVEIHFTKTKALFKYRDLMYQTRLIEGNFPNTDSLIPTQFLTSVKFNKNELISSIERVSIFTNNEASNIVKFTLNADKTCEITSTTNEIGDAKEELNLLDCSEAIPFQIAFSSAYFLEALRAFNSTEVTINFTGEIKPFIITAEYDVNLIQLILPVRAA